MRRRLWANTTSTPGIAPVWGDEVIRRELPKAKAPLPLSAKSAIPTLNSVPDRPVHNPLSITRRGQNMRYGSAVLLLAIAVIPVGVAAQNGTNGSASSDDPVALGRRLFQQNCSVCHTQPTLTNPMYGPVLYRDIVNGNEEVMRNDIARGSAKMPGFRYGLKPPEIDAIVQYLKTVPKPAQRGPQKGERPVD